ncbi:potassium-transporting ATPase subunit KdpC [Methylolobus aquaticus]|nr:potassium-transporting ATPase subunit KdpC [Methylolobus aquaticus]
MYVHLKPAFLMLLVLTLLTGAVYPAAVTGLAQLFAADQANGSLIPSADGDARGSRLIGQAFSDGKYFWGRPSATAPYPYNAAASSGSNLGPSNPALVQAVSARIAALRATDTGNSASIPVDLVTASGSGLDPHISPAAAAYQVPRVAKQRGLPVAALQEFVERHVELRQFGILGEARVNVVELNLALDRSTSLKPVR